MATKKKLFKLYILITRKPKQNYRVRGVSITAFVFASKKSSVEHWARTYVFEGVKNQNEDPEMLYIKKMTIDEQKCDMTHVLD